MTDNSRIDVRRSNGKMFFRLALCIAAMVALDFLSWTLNPIILGNWIGVIYLIKSPFLVIASLMLLVSFVILFDRAPILSFEHDGFWYKPLAFRPLEFIEWQNVETFSSGSNKWSRYLKIEVRVDEAHASRSIVVDIGIADKPADFINAEFRNKVPEKTHI